VNLCVGRSNPGPPMGVAGKPAGKGLEMPTLRDTGLVEPSKGGKMRFSRFSTWAGPPWQRIPNHLDGVAAPAGERPDLVPLAVANEHFRAFGSEKEIASALAISTHTVHDYTKALHRLFRVHSRTELMAKVARPLRPRTHLASENAWPR
jgi:hypothetical protein